MNNFCDEWECGGCGGIFDKTELLDVIFLKMAIQYYYLVDSVHEPYYACHDCEEGLLATMEKLNEN